MKKMTKYIILIVMVLSTIICYVDSLNSFLFVGSFESTSFLFEPNKTIIMILTLFYIIISFTKIKGKVPLLALVCFFWFLSGRTIAITPYPDGKITSGWFYIKLGNFSLCNGSRDCESEINQNTSVQKLSLWTIKMENGYLSKKLFVGPILWKSFNKESEEIFNKK